MLFPARPRDADALFSQTMLLIWMKAVPMPPMHHVWTVALHGAGSSKVGVAKSDTPSLGSQRVLPETDRRAQKTSSKKTYTKLCYNGVKVPHQCQKFLQCQKVFGFHLNFSLKTKPASQPEVVSRLQS